MDIFGLVCARGGSKGLPGKNTKPFKGRSLVRRAVAAVGSVSRVNSVFLSTDSIDISREAQLEGAQVPFLRPAELSEDNSPEWLVWRHMIEYLNENFGEFSGLVVTPPTAPLRSVDDIEACVTQFETNEFDIVITVTDAARNPYFNMVKKISDTRVDLVIKPDEYYTHRQDVPEMFDIATVAYVVKPSFVLKANHMFDGRVGFVYIPPERAIDIDTGLDFEIAECIATRLWN